MLKCMGFPTVSPDYAPYLVQNLPRLKECVSEFSECSTITDFGRIAYKFGFGNPNEVTTSWEKIFLQTNAMNEEGVK